MRYGLVLILFFSLLAPSAVWAHKASAEIDPAFTGFLTSWGFRADVGLVVAVLASTCTAGWWRLRNKGRRDTGRRWQLILYLTGLVVVCLALLSPIDHFATELFTMHMVQHLLLTMIAAPLLLLANPLPIFLWGLPQRIRHRIGRLLSRDAVVRQGVWVLTSMPVAWLVFVVNLWAWHHPAAYQAALQNNLIHDLQHLTFFGTALLFWWPIINPAPKLHGRIYPGFQIVYLIAATGQNTLLGALIALPERVLYPFYAAVPRLWGLSPLDDQAFAGGIMWVMGHMYLLPILLVIARALGDEERVTRQRESAKL
ncbi:MAG: cytochrome c oxidase assembly protein [Candidatus Tectomicrobia bacterium]|nr:cytochrome c oxidase assembly protein [Candidatus Tectomicrobia bacterium]